MAKLSTIDIVLGVGMIGIAIMEGAKAYAKWVAGEDWVSDNTAVSSLALASAYLVLTK